MSEQQESLASYPIEYEIILLWKLESVAGYFLLLSHLYSTVNRQLFLLG
jgi:hypothetical protein